MRARFALLTFFLVSLSSCKMLSQRRPTNEGESANILMTYFVSTQYVTDNEGFNAEFSDFYGRAIAATPPSNFDAWINPSLTCDYSDNFGVAVTPKRNVDLGKLTFAAGSASMELNPREDYSWKAFGSLPAGEYSITPEGVKRTGHFTQNFQILAHSTSILAHIGNLQAPSFKVPSPVVPASNDPSYDLRISRSEPFILNITPQNGADYVMVRIRDGSNRSLGDVTCYAKAGDLISFPPNLLAGFRTGTDGLLEIDQVSVSYQEEVERIAKSIILSTTRQVHGTFEYLDANNQLQRLIMGRLSIEP